MDYYATTMYDKVGYLLVFHSSTETLCWLMPAHDVGLDSWAFDWQYFVPASTTPEGRLSGGQGQNQHLSTNYFHKVNK